MEMAVHSIKEALVSSNDIYFCQPDTTENEIHVSFVGI